MGPTAVGKTAMAVQLARHFSTDIISADSRQCYKELSIGVARPSEDELSFATHHFIASHSIHDTVNAAVFEEYAQRKANEIFLNKDAVVMVGGTGLYIKAFCEGIDAMPETVTAVRREIIEASLQNGLQWLQAKIMEEDRLFYNSGEIHNPQRLIRALEVKRVTGSSIINFKTGVKKKRDFRIIKIGIEMERATLYERINQRVDTMIRSGLVEEVKALLPFRHLNALQTVGYSEMFRYLDGELSLAGAVELIKQHTRNYAKRQMTWFRKDKDIAWFPPNVDIVLEQLKIIL